MSTPAIEEETWRMLCGHQTPAQLKLSCHNKRAWGFQRISLDGLMEISRRARGRVSISSPYVYIEPKDDTMFPPVEEDQLNQSFTGDPHDDDSDTELDDNRSVRPERKRRYELNYLVKRRLKDKLSTEKQIERARQIFALFDYVPQTKITFRASSPNGTRRNFLLCLRISGYQITHTTFEGLSKLHHVKSCIISLSGQILSLRISVNPA